MLQLLLNGQIRVFAVVLVAIVFSLTLHEFGHAVSARLLGDDTAERMGRMTLNPLAHIDPLGLLMVVLVGFGYAKPVPINPTRFRRPWAAAAVAAAGPLMNLLLAMGAINLLAWGAMSGSFTLSQPQIFILSIVAQINLLLMVFNLLPLGPLDGHYIMTWLLPSRLSAPYENFNTRYGAQVFLVLIVLSIIGLPIFHFLMSFSAALVPHLILVS